MKNTFTILLILLANIVFSQTKISGTVKDKKENLIGTNIYLDETYDGVSSNIEGNFSFITEEKGKRYPNFKSRVFRIRTV